MSDIRAALETQWLQDAAQTGVNHPQIVALTKEQIQNLDIGGLNLAGRTLADQVAVIKGAEDALQNHIRQQNGFDQVSLGTKETSANDFMSLSGNFKNASRDRDLEDDILEMLAERDELERDIELINQDIKHLETQKQGITNTATNAVVEALGGEGNVTDQEKGYAQAIFEQSAEAQECLISYEGVPMAQLPNEADLDEWLQNAERERTPEELRMDKLRFEAETQGTVEHNGDEYRAVNDQIKGKQQELSEKQEELSQLNEQLQEPKYDLYREDAFRKHREMEIKNELEELNSGYSKILSADIDVIANKYGVKPDYIKDLSQEQGIEVEEEPELQTQNTPEPENNKVAYNPPQPETAPGMNV